MTIAVEGVEVCVNYLASNLRVTTVEWSLPVSGVTAWVRLWNEGTLFYERTISGPANGTENVPGNHRAVLVNDGVLSPHFDLPPYIAWSINVETMGL